ncbi:methionyl-tRNA formyltransferase [Candidatus Nomurabacteria bacterium]|nr:methionyl-tRNA formyltransferase [Candidatus Nomurabacteria bacterium]
MKIAFFGTPDFIVSFLNTLKDGDLTPSLIVTNPDRPSGRGMILKSPAPKTWAQEKDIKVLQPEKLDEKFFEELSSESWDLFVVIAYGKIIPEKIIDLPKYGTINIHYSLLPKYRGATPVESAILNGDETTGIAIQKMRFKLDTGPVYVKSEVDIEKNETNESLREKLNNEALKLLVSTINKIFKNSILPIEQDDSLATNCHKISKEDGEISITDDPITLDRKWRAYQSWPGLYFFKDGKRIKITKAHLDGEQFVIEEVIPENGKRINYENL